MENADDTAGAALPDTPVQTSAQPTAPVEVKRGPRPPTVLPRDRYHGLGGNFVVGTDGQRRPADAETAAQHPDETDPTTPAA